MNPVESNRIVVPLNKGKIILITIGAALFVAMGFYIWTYSGTSLRPARFVSKPVAVVGILFFGMCAVYGATKIFDKNPGLVIDDQGIIDRSSGTAVGRIDWQDIVKLSESNIAGQRFVTVFVVNPDRYISGRSALSRVLNGSNLKITGSPLNITSNTLQIEHDALFRLLTQEFERR